MYAAPCGATPHIVIATSSAATGGSTWNQRSLDAVPRQQEAERGPRRCRAPVMTWARPSTAGSKSWFTGIDPIEPTRKSSPASLPMSRRSFAR